MHLQKSQLAKGSKDFVGQSAAFYRRLAKSNEPKLLFDRTEESRLLIFQIRFS